MEHQHADSDVFNRTMGREEWDGIGERGGGEKGQGRTSQKVHESPNFLFRKLSKRHLQFHFLLCLKICQIPPKCFLGCYLKILWFVGTILHIDVKVNADNMIDT